MANLNEMKAAAAAQGASAPPDYPGGPDAWVADWYQNAVNAGSIQGTRTKGELTATDATTGATPQGYKNTGTSSFADMIRAKAKAEGWSEDFERFSDAQIDAWKSFYDEKTGRFRSENDPSGAATYDKPSECPPGTTLHGSKCVSWESLPYELGGTGTSGPAGGGGQAGGAPGAPAATGRDRLQQALVDQYQGREGMFVGQPQGGEELSGGGIFWGQQPAGGASPLASAISSGSGATPLSAGVAPAPSAANPSPAPAPTPRAETMQQGFSTFAPAATNIQTQGSIGQSEAAPGQAPGATSLQRSLQRQYPNPDQWWQKGALEI